MREIAAKIIADYKEHYDFPWQGESHMEDCIMGNLQSLSQEAVRDEALEEAERRVVEAAVDDFRSGCTITAHNLVNATRTLLELRALKREPNAVARWNEKRIADIGVLPGECDAIAGPAPAAPDAVIVRLKQLASGQGTVSPERRHDAKAIADTCNQAAALLAKLWQGWISDDKLSFCEDCGMYIVSKPRASDE